MDELEVDDLILGTSVDRDGYINIYAKDPDNYIDKYDAELIIAHLKEIFEI